MRRGLIVAAALVAGLVTAPAAYESPAGKPPRASISPDGTVRIGGRPRFLIGAGWPTPAAVPRALTLGIDLLQGNGPGATQLAISQAVGSKGWVVPHYTLKQLHAHYHNAIGYSLPDEPDEKGLLPAVADPDRGPRLPPTPRAAKTGVLIMQTLTSHFMSSRSKPAGIGETEYRQYAMNADVVLTDVYPLAHGCVDPGVTMSMVYDAMIELKQLAPSRAVGEWIETGPIEGYCGPDPVDPAVARAEAWASVAGGAQALFWFTHTFTKGYWDDFDVSPAMAAAIERTNAELVRFTSIVLGRRVPSVVSAPSDPIKVGVRIAAGRAFLIAVNLSGDEVELAKDAAAEQWWSRLPRLLDQRVVEHTTGRLADAVAGRFDDTIPPWGLRIYSWPLTRRAALPPAAARS
jgi:hypothetical protein